MTRLAHRQQVAESVRPACPNAMSFPLSPQHGRATSCMMMAPRHFALAVTTRPIVKIFAYVRSQCSRHGPLLLVLLKTALYKERSQPIVSVLLWG